MAHDLFLLIFSFFVFRLYSRRFSYESIFSEWSLLYIYIYVHLHIFDFYIYISVHLYYINNWWCLCFSNSDLPFQQCLPIRKKHFQFFLLLKPMKWRGFQEPMGFLQTSARTSKTHGIFRRSQTVLAAGGMGLTFGLMLAANLRSKDSYVCTRPEPARGPGIYFCPIVGLQSEDPEAWNNQSQFQCWVCKVPCVAILHHLTFYIKSLSDSWLRVAWPHGIWTIWRGAKTNGSFLGPISQETPVTELRCIFCCNLVFPNGTRKTSGQRTASLDGIQHEASQSTTGPDEGDGQT